MDKQDTIDVIRHNLRRSRNQRPNNNWIGKNISVHDLVIVINKIVCIRFHSTASSRQT
jgi:hypothetical protein